MRTLIKTTARLMASAAFFAAPDQAQLMSEWSGDASLSRSKTDGNTETTDVGLGLNLTKTDGIWRNKFDVNYDLGSVSGQDTKNRLFLGY